MRALVGTLAFVVLVLAGFFTTQDVLTIVNFEYQRAWSTQEEPLRKVTDAIVETNNKIYQSDAEIASLESSLQEQMAAANTSAARMNLENASPTEISKKQLEYGEKVAGLQRSLTRVRNAKAGLETQARSLKKSQDEFQAKIEASKSDNTNLYLVTRALALGAIGALMSILAKFLSSKRRTLFDDGNPLTRMWASMAMGAIVGVVAIGLFYTGFISIFSQPQPPGVTPVPSAGNLDFWKITIVCLLAGAFSDRLFQAAAGRMDRYLGNGDTVASETTATAQQKNTPGSKPKRVRKPEGQERPQPARPAAGLVEINKPGNLSGAA